MKISDEERFSKIQEGASKDFTLMAMLNIAIHWAEEIEEILGENPPDDDLHKIAVSRAHLLKNNQFLAMAVLLVSIWEFGPKVFPSVPFVQEDE